MDKQQVLSRVILRDPVQGCWFEYINPVHVFQTDKIDKVALLLSEIEHLVEQEHYYATGFVSYEAASAFDSHLITQLPRQLPLLCFGLFKDRTRLDELPQQPEPHHDNWHLDSTEPQYREQISILKEHIEAGDIYQVNYTARLKVDGAIDIGTFRQIAEQATYGAYLEGENFSIASASPELFFQRIGTHIVCKPMKGTAARGLSSVNDMQQADWLRSSEKNQAENLMITDMVRNDLSRVAEANSVKVSRLFDIERHPTVWQMTSTVSAETSATTQEVFRALFPGASITGAPKRASMNFIHALETSPREIYTGAIGLIAPGNQALFSIAIRTAWTDKRTNTSHYGAGGGIVWDSNAEDEYAELQAKTRILQRAQSNFQLLETMRWTPDEGIYLKARHLQRLSDSAEYFGFKIDPALIDRNLSAATLQLASHSHRIRLRVDRKGDIQLECEPLHLADRTQQVGLSKDPISIDNTLLYHKTTNRNLYENATASVPEGIEALLHNDAGFVTESAIANIVYQRRGKFFTPPVSDGLLPGTLREELIASGKVKLRSLPVEELANVEALFLVNALRGWRRAELFTV